MTNNNRIVISILTLAGGALFIVLLLHLSQKNNSTIVPGSAFSDTVAAVWENSAFSTGTLFGGAVPIAVSIARTQLEQEQGLSGTPSLKENTGKLFVFKAVDRYGFWMKDMHYPIDLVWISADHRISEITENVLPETYPTVFYPQLPVQYVLEINANTASARGLTVGTTLVLKKQN